MNIVILAAGQGKRMRSLQPKVLHSIAGQSMLSHVLQSARRVAASRAGSRIVVVVGHGADAVRQAFAAASNVPFVVQEPQLGTGHAVLQALPSLADGVPTMVLYGDVPLIRAETLERLMAAAADGSVAILTVKLVQPAGYGRIVRDQHGKVLRIVEERDANDEERAITEVNTGILVAPTAPLRQWLAALSADNAQHEYYLTDIIASAVAQQVPVAAVLATADETLGVNSKAQLAHAERVAQLRAADALMEQGATLSDPARIDVRGHVSIGADVSIDINCVFEGEVTLADRVHIGPHCVLRDCQIGADTEVLAFSHLDGASVGARARIGPYARLRPGAQLADEVHIGNFVEVKASSIGHGSKANHLSYIGDASVGAQVNIGAGTITANYDGVNKHRTEIGNDASIGSNVVLVAPVSVGVGATVGGGSTISKNVPAGKLAVARGKQQIIEGWKRPQRKPGK